MQVAEPSPLATRAAETAPDAAHPLRTEVFAQRSRPA